MSSLFVTAFIEAVVVGLLCGLVGCLVVLRRRVFYTNSLTHATFPGGIVAALLGLNVVVGAVVFSVLLVGMMTLLSRNRRQGPAVASGIVLTFGFALGSFLDSINTSLPVKAEEFLVGSILTVSSTDVWLAAGVLVAAVAAFALFGKELLFSTFDRAGFRAAGFRESAVDLGALALMAATVVVAMPAVGSILAISLIAAPAAAARLVTRTIGGMLAVSAVLGAASGVLGLLVSLAIGSAAGGTIALVAAAFFALAWLLSRMLGARRSAVAVAR